MTLRQKALAKNIGKYKTIEEAMIKSDYAPSTSHQQQEIISGKGFQDLMEQYLPDDNLLAVHEAGLKAMKPIGALVLIKNDKDGKTQQILKDNEGMIEVEDHATRAKFLELGYKIKGKLKEGINVQGDLNMNVTIVRHAV